MNEDERKIRELINTWMQATAAGDASQLVELMDQDVVFLLPGQPPMRGREKFIESFQAAVARCRIEATPQIQEIQVVSDIAYCWNSLSVTVTPLPSGPQARRSGHTLSVLRKQANSQWVLFRDANLLTAEAPAPRG